MYNFYICSLCSIFLSIYDCYFAGRVSLILITYHCYSPSFAYYPGLSLIMFSLFEYITLSGLRESSLRRPHE